MIHCNENDKEETEVVVVDPDGNVLDDEETQEFLLRLQSGVFCLSQDR